MIIIDMSQFRIGHTEHEAQAAVRRLLFPMLQQAEDKPHVHPYAIVLMDQDNGTGVELTAFEAPCPNGNDRGHVRALVDALRELADEIRDAHADLLAEEKDTRTCAHPGDQEHDHAMCQDVVAEDAEAIPAHVLRDLLLVVCVTVSEAAVEGWTPEQRKQAEEWAAATHLSASDNDVTVPPRPEFLAEAELGEG